MSRRIIGQCHRADFIALLERGKALSINKNAVLPQLTRRQSIATGVIGHFLNRRLPMHLLTGGKVKEVLVWESDKGETFFEYKLMDPHDRETADLLNARG